jgi:hypothetical protein
MCIAINEINRLENVPVLEVKPDIMVVVCTNNSAQRYIKSIEPKSTFTSYCESLFLIQPYPKRAYISPSHHSYQGLDQKLWKCQGCGVW